MRIKKHLAGYLKKKESGYISGLRAFCVYTY